MEDQAKDLKKLGSYKTDYCYQGPSTDILETFPNAFPGRAYEVVHSTEEFTSLCPKTGQPDFAKITITFCPDEKCVESKSLKLYLFSFRQHGSFMETIVNKIHDDLKEVMEPRWITVVGDFGARGGVSTLVRASSHKEVPPPHNL